MREGSGAEELGMVGESDSGVDRQRILREMEDAVFEPPRPVLTPGEGPEEEMKTVGPAVAPARPVRRTGLAGLVLILAGAAWAVQSSISKSWIACLLAAGFLAAGLLLLGRVVLREKP